MPPKASSVAPESTPSGATAARVAIFITFSAAGVTSERHSASPSGFATRKLILPIDDGKSSVVVS